MAVSSSRQAALRAEKEEEGPGSNDENEEARNYEHTGETLKVKDSDADEDAVDVDCSDDASINVLSRLSPIKRTHSKSGHMTNEEKTKRDKRSLGRSRRKHKATSPVSVSTDQTEYSGREILEENEVLEIPAKRSSAKTELLHKRRKKEQRQRRVVQSPTPPPPSPQLPTASSYRIQSDEDESKGGEATDNHIYEPSTLFTSVSSSSSRRLNIRATDPRGKPPESRKASKPLFINVSEDEEGEDLKTRRNQPQQSSSRFLKRQGMHAQGGGESDAPSEIQSGNNRNMKMRRRLQKKKTDLKPNKRRYASSTSSSSSSSTAPSDAGEYAKETDGELEDELEGIALDFDRPYSLLACFFRSTH